MKKWLKFIFGILISVVIIYMLLKVIDIKSVIKIIKSAKIVYLIIVFFIGILLILLRSFRWRMFLKQYKEYNISLFFESTNVGLTMNNFLPFRIGDLVQAYLLSKKSGLSKSLTFSTVLMERFIDFFPPIIFIIIGSFYVILPKEISLPLAGIIFIGLIVFIVIIIKFKNIILNKIEMLLLKKHFYVKFYNILKNFYVGIENFKDIKLLSKIVPITFLLWSGYSLTAYLCCLSLGIDLPSFWSAFLVHAIIVLSVLVPSSPGYIGTWEAMSIFALKIFGIDETLGLAFGLVFHLMCMLPVIVFGLYYLMKEFTIIKNVAEEN